MVCFVPWWLGCFWEGEWEACGGLGLGVPYVPENVGWVGFGWAWGAPGGKTSPALQGKWLSNEPSESVNAALANAALELSSKTGRNSQEVNRGQLQKVYPKPSACIFALLLCGNICKEQLFFAGVPAIKNKMVTIFKTLRWHLLRWRLTLSEIGLSETSFWMRFLCANQREVHVNKLLWWQHLHKINLKSFLRGTVDIASPELLDHNGWRHCSVKTNIPVRPKLRHIPRTCKGISFDVMQSHQIQHEGVTECLGCGPLPFTSYEVICWGREEIINNIIY